MINSTARRPIWPFLLLALTTLATANTIQTVIVTMTAEPSVPAPSSYTSPSVFKESVMSMTNICRKRHNADPLVWNSTLAEFAQNWAEKCNWKHSDSPYGENLAFGYPNASAAVCAWADEASLYNFHTPTGFSEKTGHFTQLVWQATEQVGCAAVDCGYSDHPMDGDGHFEKAQGWFVVCEYMPPGNVVGRDNAFFVSNVAPAVTGLLSSSTASLHGCPGAVEAATTPTGTTTQQGKKGEAGRIGLGDGGWTGLLWAAGSGALMLLI